MRKRISIAVAALTMCCGLTGCMGEIANVKINDDGSGTINLSVGISENAMEMMSSIAGEDSETDTSEMVPFEYNGTTYYGEIDSVEFNSIVEFNEMMNDLGDAESAGTDTGVIELSKREDGALELVIATNSNTGDTSTLEESMAESSSEIDEATMELLMQDMAVVFEFTFPNEVVQVQGPSEGIKIDGNKLIIDFIEMGKNISDTAVYVFESINKEVKPSVSEEPIVSEEKPIMFSDVPETMWCYDAVRAMANKGVISGVGNGRFDPNGILTYAQFCSIVARDCSLETGELNGYWAGKAIKSCISAGFIQDLGEITRENYDKPITREAAVSAMYLIDRGENGVVKEVSESDIPDFETISAEYRENILLAYKAGITSGMDESGTFNPKGELTRAQICTLYYNMSK